MPCFGDRNVEWLLVGLFHFESLLPVIQVELKALPLAALLLIPALYLSSHLHHYR